MRVSLPTHLGAAQLEHGSPLPDGTRTKTVLMIDYFFPPLGGAGVQRTLGYVRHLSAFGWMPIVLTVRSGEHFVHDASLLERVPKTVAVRRSGSLEPVRFVKALLPPKPPARNTAGRQSSGWIRKTARRLHRLEPWLLFPDRHLGWLPFAVAEAISIGRNHRVDAIYTTSTSVTSHLVGYVLKTVWGIPWVADFQDPWARNYTSPFPSPVHQRIADHVESRIIKKADRVTVTTEPLRDVLRSQHSSVSSDKIVVIPMGFDPEMFVEIQRVSRAKFTLTHCGNFYGPRSPGPLLTALSQWFREDPDVAQHVDVRLLGGFDPPLRALTEEMIMRNGLGEVVHLEGTVPYGVGLQHMVSSDVLLLVTDPGGCGQNLIPSKLYEYLAAGRVILALAPEGGVARVIRATGAGVLVPPDDIGGIREAIASLYTRWKEGRLDTPIRPEESVRQFTWRALTGQFTATLQEALVSVSGRGCATRV